MAGVSVGSGGGGGRKPVDTNLNLVPMIDLLIAVIAFLLITAVWVQTGVLQARQPRTSEGGAPPPPTTAVTVVIAPGGLRVGYTAADMVDIPAGPRQLDSLRDELRRRHQADGQVNHVTLQPDSVVSYNDIAGVMDAVYDVWGAGQPRGRPVADAVAIQLL
jgi:biopolymer transport protein ExbD